MNTYICGICRKSITKKEAEYVDENEFIYQSNLSENLKHSHYCESCFDEVVKPAKEKYLEILKLAKGMPVLMKSYRGFTPLIKKSRIEVSVSDCPDREDLIMKLAFLSVEQGFNAIIQTDIVCEKVRNNGRQKSKWSGKALPATINTEKLELEEYREEVWRRGN